MSEAPIERDLSAEGIRAQRIKRGLSQPALALRVGVTATAVRYWEWGKRSPSPALRAKLAAELYGADPTQVEAITLAALEFLSERDILTGPLTKGDYAGLEQAVADALTTHEAGL